MKPLTHVDEHDRPAMVDVSDKSVSRREATARCIVRLPQVVRDAIDGDEIASRKGPVFATAIIAGVMAAKRTHELIPFCHPLGLEKCAIDIRLVDDAAVVECTCRVEHKTGVEMEALTGATVAALTIYDMVKALSHDVVIAETRLIAKSGGRSDYRHEGGP
ncbi:MAG TPA: cyclic pyranopterin monophosphate synthase MoaC [Woeseiaceae bacterium]|nr:cyclic pyranopterin monophosphate synthase MoaC [Woeseiaceae bacterium]